MGEMLKKVSMVTGKVTGLKFKDLGSPDRFENTHRAMMWIEDVNHEGKQICFMKGVKDKGRGAALNVQFNGEWVQLAEGDEVQFKFKQNGDFFNFSSVEVLEKGNGTPPQSQGSSGASVTQSQPSFDPSAPNPAAIGQAMNLAVELKLAKKYDDLMDEAKVIEAIKAYKKAKQTFTDLWDKATPAPAENDVMEEDDVPF